MNELLGFFFQKWCFFFVKKKVLLLILCLFKTSFHMFLYCVEQRIFHYVLIFQVPKVKYISEMAETGSYGGEPEIQAVCYAYQVQVELFMGGLASPIMCRSYGNSTSPLVKLSYVSDGVFDSGHYDLVVDSADDALSSEVAYGKWRVQKIEDYQLSDRLANNNLYG